MSKETHPSTGESFEIPVDASSERVDSTYGYEGNVTTTLDESLIPPESDSGEEEDESNNKTRRGQRGGKKHGKKRAEEYKRRTEASSETGSEERESLRITSAEKNVPKEGREARREPSEDAVLRNDEFGIYGVFDGVGGAHGGSTASNSAARTVEQIARSYTENPPERFDPADPNHNLELSRGMLHRANETIRKQQEGDESLKDMATTGTILYRFQDGQGREMAAYASAGDSSLLRVRNGEVEFVTQEEFLPDQPNVITNALNGNESFDVDTGNLGVMEIQSGDRLVLLSDGISGDWDRERLSLDEYKAALDPANSPDPEAATEALVSASRKEDDKGVVVIDVEGEAGQQEPDETAVGTAGSEQQPPIGSGEYGAGGLSEEDQAAYTQALDEYTRFMEQEGRLNEYQRWADEFIQNEVKLFGTSPLEREATEAESALMETRARLAEAAVHAREGKLIGNKKLRAELEAATQDYQDAWTDFMDELQQRTNASSEYMHALLATADAREEGALAGEEANYYLEQQNQWSKFDHLAAVYEKMSPWERRAAMGVGILATASIGGIAGLAGAGGGAAAGLAASGRFGKVSFSGEVKRRVNKLNRSEQEKQEASTLRPEETGTSAYLEYRQRHRRLQDINQRRQSGPDTQEPNVDAKQFITEDMYARQNRTAERTTGEADEETKAKRRVARKAGIVATGGALAGNLIEGGLESLGIGAEDVDTESGADEVEQENQEPEQGNRQPQEQSETEETGQGEAGETAETDAGIEAAPNDISAELGLPEGYIAETSNGYEVTAMPGIETDSIWRAAEHSLHDYIGQQPSTGQINELQNMLGNHWLDVGDKVTITDSQIEQALAAINA